MKLKTTMKSLAIGSAVMALSALSVSVMAAAKPAGKSGASDSGSITQIASNIYGVLQTAYVQSNARLQQVDNYLQSFIQANTPVFVPQTMSTGVEKSALSNPNLLFPVTMNYMSNAVQGANSLATANSAINQIPFSASMASTIDKTKSNPMLGNNAASNLYLPWYQYYQNLTPTGSLLSDPKNIPSNTPGNYLTNLTTGLPATDSFMYSSPFMTSQDRQQALMNNNYFNFMNYFEPTNGAYSTTPPAGVRNVNTDLNMARGYVEFLSRVNEPIGSDLVKVLQQYNVNGMLAAPSIKKIADIMKGDNYNDSYKKFILNERQYNAVRSMINGLMSQIWVERAPVKGAAANILSTANPTDEAQIQQQYFNANDKTLSASPLQIERYNRTHRVNDPKWYQQMSTASPATIAREQLYVSAQLLAADQQAHEDREKLLLAQLVNDQNYLQATLKPNLQMSASALQADLCKALGSNASGICSSGGSTKKLTKK